VTGGASVRSDDGAMPAALVRRPLGTTGVTAPRLIFGTAPLSSIFWNNTEARALEAIATARAVGYTAFDTAPLYGLGEAEARLGAGLALAADGGDDAPTTVLTIATKVGHTIVGAGDDRSIVADFSRAGTRRQLETSLERLGRDRVDIVHVHDPEGHLGPAVDECVAELDELRSAGLLTAISVGTNHCETALHFLEHADPDVVMVAGRLTLLDRRALDEVLPACREAGVPLLAAAVFNSGVLARPTDGSWFDYAPASADVLDRVTAMEARCRDHGVPLLAAALQYPLRFDGVAAVVVGTGTAEEATANAELASLELPDDLWADLDEL